MEFKQILYEKTVYISIYLYKNVSLFDLNLDICQTGWKQTSEKWLFTPSLIQ
jgi:hypothetical protein